MISMSNSQDAIILAIAAVPAVLLAVAPASAQIETLPQRPAAQSPQSPPRPPAQERPPAPSPTQVATQLAACQDWVSRALPDVLRSNINVTPRGREPQGGIVDIQWRIQDGTTHGLCRVRRNGSVLQALMYTPNGLLHYFPTDTNDVGIPIE
jgi:hypothetical protein